MSKDLNSNSVSQRTPYSAIFLNPENVIGGLSISSGMKVAHFGCGTGYFTFAIAKKIGSGGTVWAFDVLAEKIEALESQAKLAGFGNILATRTNLEKKEGSGLPENSVDWVFIVNMLYQNENRSQIILEAKRILKEGGHIFIADWKDTSGSFGPEIKSRVSEGELIKIARKNKLGLLKEVEVSDFHFGFVLQK